jgi:hypothetical protein
MNNPEDRSAVVVWLDTVVMERENYRSGIRSWAIWDIVSIRFISWIKREP